MSEDNYDHCDAKALMPNCSPVPADPVYVGYPDGATPMCVKDYGKAGAQDKPSSSL